MPMCMSTTCAGSCDISHPMSYVVDIVATPIPHDDAEAWPFAGQIRDTALSEGIGPTSQIFRELHRRLTARFPCICDDESGPWSYGPLINDFGAQIAMVGIAGSRIDEVLPFVIETATDMNLCVFDHQAAEIHRPKTNRG